MKKNILISIIFFIFSFLINPINLHSAVDNRREALNVLYTEAVCGIFMGSISINYERFLNNYLSIRYGIGKSIYIHLFGDDDYYYGHTFMLNLFNRNNLKLEFGLGISLMKHYKSEGEIVVNKPWKICPAIAAGYRYQPLSHGWMFRIVFSNVYYCGRILSASFGCTF
ncbi:MAG: hypothetical protein KAS64_00660 [Spirochaetes bacterium]|nr:hypothetical protein [Spirochaetota bacterium]